MQVGSGQSGPVTTDAAAVFHNPGQLGFLREPQLMTGLGAVFGRVAFQRQRLGRYPFEQNDALLNRVPVDPRAIDPSKTGNADNVTASPFGPTFDLFGAIPLWRDRLTIGLGLYVPYAALLDLPKNGPQRFALTSVTNLSVQSTLALAYAVHERVSLGAGVTYAIGLLDIAKTQDFAALDSFGEALGSGDINQPNNFGANAPTELREQAVYGRPFAVKKGRSHNATFNVGLAAKPTDKLDIGLTYHHGAKQRFRGKFEIDMDDPFFTDDLQSEGLAFPKKVRGNATIIMRLPKRLWLGIAYAVHKKVRLELDVGYAFYSQFKRIDITTSSPDFQQSALDLGTSIKQSLPLGWKDAVQVELRPHVQALPKLNLSALLGYHSPVSKDARMDLSSIDGHRIVFGGAMAWTPKPRFSLIGSFEGQAIVPRVVQTSYSDLGNGRYELFVGTVLGHLQVHFDPIHAKQ